MRKSKLIVLLNLLALSFALGCASLAGLKSGDGISPGERAITAKDLFTHLSFLASDEMKGRNTLTNDLKTAAKYIAIQAQSYGLKTILPGDKYMQDVPFIAETADAGNSYLELTIDDKTEKLELNSGFTSQMINSLIFKEGVVKGDLVFLGYGAKEDSLDWDDIGDIDVRGKVAVLLDAELPDGHEVGEKQNNSLLLYRAVGLFQKGMRGFIVISENPLYEESKKMLLKGYRADPAINDLPIFGITFDVASKIIGKSESEIKVMIETIESGEKVPTWDLPGKSVNIKIESNSGEENSQNVVAVLEGSDPVLKNEYVLYGAHYDHDGVVGGKIFNGADDDGSGTVTLLEIAQSFSIERPKRSIIFAWHTAEEKGLLGSKYLSDNFPVPLDKVSGVINMDMVGRNSDKPLWVIGAGRLSSELYKINEKINKDHIMLEFDYQYDDPKHPENFYERSDHYMYARYGIPIVFYSSGTHPDYHQPSDTVDKIEFDHMQRIGRLAYLVGKEIANRDNMLKLDADPKVTTRGKHNVETKKQ